MVEVILISVIAGAVANLLRAVRIGDRAAEVLSKTTASVAFVALGAVAWTAGRPVATWLLVGLGLCAAGDVLLIWDRTFGAGLWTFLLGHVAYIHAFHRALPATSWPPWPALPIAAASFAAGVWLWPHLDDRRVPVGAYLVVITVMVWGAVATAAAGAMPLTVAAGAGLFYLSDLAVARQRFVTPDIVNRVVGLPIYFAGQVLIALSV